MNKLKLNLDELEVQSFVTNLETQDVEGTVQGYRHTCPGYRTCDFSCNGTCYNTCNWGTCDGWETGDGNCC